MCFGCFDGDFLVALDILGYQVTRWRAFGKLRLEGAAEVMFGEDAGARDVEFSIQEVRWWTQWGYFVFFGCAIQALHSFCHVSKDRIMMRVISNFEKVNCVPCSLIWGRFTRSSV